MSNIDQHPNGAFCWVELGTTDQEAAKAFYGQIFGWTAMDNPMGPDMVYTTFLLDGLPAAAGYKLGPQQGGAPPHWMLYISVASADDTAAKATELGAAVMAGPFDVMTFGRMAVIKDPTGAIISVWQPMTHQGIRIAGVPGTLCWADLATPDVPADSDFYKALVGWTIKDEMKDPSGYLHIENGTTMIGGIPPSSHIPAGVPPHWLPYFLVADTDATSNLSASLGAHLIVPPMTMENVGRMAVIADPQGAVFAIFQPMMPPPQA